MSRSEADDEILEELTGSQSQEEADEFDRALKAPRPEMGNLISGADKE